MRSAESGLLLLNNNSNNNNNNNIINTQTTRYLNFGTEFTVETNSSLRYGFKIDETSENVQIAAGCEILLSFISNQKDMFNVILTTIPAERYQHLTVTKPTETYSIRFSKNSNLNNTSLEVRHYCPNGIMNAKLGQIAGSVVFQDKLWGITLTQQGIATSILSIPIISSKLQDDLTLTISFFIPMISKAASFDVVKPLYGPSILEFNPSSNDKLTLKMPSVPITAFNAYFKAMDRSSSSPWYTSSKGYATLFSLFLIGGETSKATLSYQFKSTTTYDTTNKQVSFLPSTLLCTCSYTTVSLENILKSIEPAWQTNNTIICNLYEQCDYLAIVAKKGEEPSSFELIKYPKTITDSKEKLFRYELSANSIMRLYAIRSNFGSFTILVKRNNPPSSSMDYDQSLIITSLVISSKTLEVQNWNTHGAVSCYILVQPTTHLTIDYQFSLKEVEITSTHTFLAWSIIMSTVPLFFGCFTLVAIIIIVVTVKRNGSTHRYTKERLESLQNNENDSINRDL